MVRHGLRLMLEATEQMVVVGMATDGLAVLSAPEIERSDVVILDLSLPRMSGAEVLRRLRERWPELPIILLSMYPEDNYAIHLLKEGASAYLSKDRPPEDLIAAIRKVVRGGTYLTDTIAEQALRTGNHEGDPPHLRLSPREQEVFRLIVQGRSVSEIAAEMDLNVSTISNHLRRIKEKLDARTIADIVGYAHRVGISGPHSG